MHPLLTEFEACASQHGDKPAACDQSLALTYSEFRAAACGLATRIAGDTERPQVGILAPTSSACAAAVFACWYAGRVPVPLNFMLAPPELVKIVRDADLDLIVAVEPFAPLVAAAGARRLPLDGHTLAPGMVHPPTVQPSDLAALLYTSGTAGDPKGVCLSFANLAQNAAACVAAMELNAEHVFLGLLPQFHAFGLTTTTIVPLLLGATVYYLPRFSPVTVTHLIAEKRVSIFITIASMFGALAAMKGATRDQFASLQLPVSGGEPLSAKAAQAFEERCGARIYEGYGMTEASPVVTLNTPRAYRAGTVGRPLPGIAVTAVDPKGHALPPGQDGELVIHGHCVMQGYRNQPELTAATIRDGALWTGDIGRVDADGFVSITGRAKEMLIVGGENVFPLEIESVLLRHPAVAEAAVIGVRDDIRGELPTAFIVPVADAAPPTENELRAFCREQLAAYKVPRRIYIAADFPRSPTGKILKRALPANVS